jgi:hypothetical protein
MYFNIPSFIFFKIILFSLHLFRVLFCSVFSIFIFLFPFLVFSSSSFAGGAMKECKTGREMHVTCHASAKKKDELHEEVTLNTPIVLVFQAYWPWRG